MSVSDGGEPPNMHDELDDMIGNVEKPFSSTFSLRGAALSDRIDWV